MIIIVAASVIVRRRPSRSPTQNAEIAPNRQPTSCDNDNEHNQMGQLDTLA